MMHQQLSKTNQRDEHWETDSSIESVPPISVPVHPILRLQQTVGNQAVQRLLRSGGNVQPKLKPNAMHDTINNALDIHEAARSGLNGDAQPLPYLNTIQQSFGRHDVTGVKAHVSGAAREANERMGAWAYTTGKSVVFRQTPDLHTAAHEAAHVVQQRAGVQLAGGVGQADDRYEQQADAVAETVVQGRSAKSLLDGYPETDVAPSRHVQFLADGPHVTGPPDVGSCTLRSGKMQWSLVPMIGYVNVRIEFTPNPTVAAASKTISFVQTVSETLTTGGFLGIGSTTVSSGTEVDVLPGETDPFYGAKWNPAAKQWGDEPGSSQARPGDYQKQGAPREGSRPFIASVAGSAVLNDSPMLQINQTKQFETVAVVVETGLVLGSLSWNVQRWRAGFLDRGSSTTVRRAACAEGASTDFSSVLESFYSGTSGMVVLDGFAAGSAELPATYAQRLAPILDRLRREPTRRVNVGGAATQDEPNPTTLSQSRAETVKAYFVGQGIEASRIAVEAYGGDWARTPVTSPGAAQANRRVQITILRP
jgi:outer membrane protein OmpA-like peptidoglycan-associated protein